MRQVAQANKLKSANRIFEGQTLDLSALTPESSTSVAASHAPLAQGGKSKPWRPSVSDLADLVRAVELKGSAGAPAATGVSGEKASVLPVLAGASEVTSDFGTRRNPFTGKLETHMGIDIAADAGTKVYAAKAGTVVSSGWQPGYGNTVVVRHADGTETLYAHNRVNLVTAGQAVDGKTALAKVGSTGSSTGPHVHFELHRNGVAVNPVGSGGVQLARHFK